MAPPASRRRGFSRKAQYGLFLGYVAAVGGALLAILLLVVAMVDPRGFAALRGAALDITMPISAGGRAVVRGVADSGAAVGAYFRAGSQNEELRERLAAAERRLIKARAIEFENARLKRLLKLGDSMGAEVATARIVGSSFDSSRRLATLSAGSAAGVNPGQPVRAPEGLIGRVLETGRYASRILLLTDAASNVPVRLARDGTPALATGRGDGTIEIKPLTVGRNPFERGDILVTSGTGGLYPPNVPVALVTLANRDITVARPLADPARIDFAIVEAVYQPAADLPLDTARPPSPERAP